MVAENPRVLVVDDDDAIRSMIERVLRREAYQVESARDGFEAIEKLSQTEYGTILLDLMMPRIDGHGVLRYLEEERKLQKKSVIVMTANLHGAHKSAHAEPVFRVLPKPFDIRQLIDHVRECVKQADERGDHDGYSAEAAGSADPQGSAAALASEQPDDSPSGPVGVQPG